MDTNLVIVRIRLESELRSCCHYFMLPLPTHKVRYWPELWSGLLQCNQRKVLSRVTKGLPCDPVDCQMLTWFPASVPPSVNRPVSVIQVSPHWQQPSYTFLCVGHTKCWVDPCCLTETSKVPVMNVTSLDWALTGGRPHLEDQRGRTNRHRSQLADKW